MDKTLLENSTFHNPILKLEDGEKKSKVLNILKDFRLSREKLKRVQDAFIEEMNMGLSLNPSRRSTIQMENTFVPGLPDGTEQGDFLSLDLGSTNFRVLLTRLSPDKEAQFKVKHYNVPAELRKGDAIKLFDFFASCIADFVNQCLPDNKKSIPLGFTFSFPTSQEALDASRLITWTKNFDCPNAVGQNVVELLHNAINTRNNLNIEIVAVLNDATGTLVKGAYLQHDCAIVLIMGSGGNACYLEKIKYIEKWTDKNIIYENVEEVIINMECGSFGDNGMIDFAKTCFDFELDEQSLFPHSFTFEKTFGGTYIGEIVRLSLIRLINEKLLFDGNLTDEISMKNSLSAAHLSIIESNNQDSIIKIIENLGYKNFTQNDIEIIKYVCAILSVRNALLLSACLAVLVQRINKPSVSIAVDGSVYKNHPKMHQLMTDFIAELAPNRKFKIILAEDGSGTGAGLVAAVAKKFKSKI